MPSVIVASPLLRARQTAEPIADRAGRDVTTDRRLLDRDYGQWAGIDRESVAARWGSVDDAPGVEPVWAVRDRAVRGLTDIARRSRGGTVVVVSHDAVNRQLLVACAGMFIPAGRGRAPGTTQARKTAWPAIAAGQARNAASDGGIRGPARAIDTEACPGHRLRRGSDDC